MKRLYVAWQNEDNREWIPVAMLTENDNGYALRYTRGAKRCKNFSGLGRMLELDKEYVSHELFPFFANRMISKSRPEYKNYLRWLGLTDLTGDPMTVLAATGGLRATDSFELIPPPRKDGDRLRLNFFSRGLRHMPSSSLNTVASLNKGAQLYLLRDLQNSHDEFALLLRTEDPKVLVGYVPRYYCPGLVRLLKDFPQEVVVEVQQVNPDAPLDMRLLCSLNAPWVDNQKLLESVEDFLPWSNEAAIEASGNAIQQVAKTLDLND